MSYSKEQFKKLYQTLPPALKEALGSVEIQDEIDEICRENGVTDPSLVDKVYNLVMDVFMDLVHPDNFEGELAQLLQDQESATREIAHRIRRFIIFPLKAEIAQLHRIEASPAPQPQQPQAEEEGYIIEPSEEKQEQKEKEQGGPDQYREPVE